MPATTLTTTRTPSRPERNLPSVLVACPDARPPAYQAVVGLAHTGQLDRFLTSFYDKGPGALSRLIDRCAPSTTAAYQRFLTRRRHPQIPTARVLSRPSVDLSLVAESKLTTCWPGARRYLARRRTERFDRQLANVVKNHDPEVCFTFSDVGSRLTLPACRELGIPTVLSMVTGDVREECEVLEREAARAPEWLPIYLGDGRLDRNELDWLHARRLSELQLADRILVPSEHIAATLARLGTPRERIRVVPYAADTQRFQPLPDKLHTQECIFLFAGGITQRKGIKDLLDAWKMVRRPGWRLQLLGPLPRDPGPLKPFLSEVELLGRVGHADVAKIMANADVFVFPSLFEGSAVVTYEALASGLPSIVTANAGSVVRDGEDGMIVPSADPDRLADAMRRLGCSAELRAMMARSARERALEFDWPRYHTAIAQACSEVSRTSRSYSR